MKSFEEMGFDIEFTKDGSPSLRIKSGELLGEAMHHSGGAYSETDLIYGDPIRHVLLKKQGGHFLVVGLGLGYIEILLARECLSYGIPPSKINLMSFESEPGLIENFKDWISVSHRTNSVYDTIADIVLSSTKLSSSEIKNYLQELYSGASKILGPLNRESIQSRYFKEADLNKNSVNCILFDAFSAKTTPTLWDESFLIYFLDQVASEDCIFATYACRGSLKRALTHCNFTVESREGFMGKRNSTRAIKGALFTSPLDHVAKQETQTY